jgi:protein-S-isoprenylcysteine O-methyltransferase Ste14
MMAIFQAWIGVLFLLRKPVARPGGTIAILLSAPSVLFSGIALKLSSPAIFWKIGPTVLFAIGMIFALVSLSFLGKSFAVLPASRQTVRRGPYRWIRHPAYAGEMLMIIACAVSAPWPAAVWIAPLALLLLVIRILAEERTLSADADYQAYRGETRWRLLPKIW